jgi:hypothetical protein
MANNTEDNTPLGNIRQEYNNATVGLNLDQTANQIKPGTLTYALNANVENFDANSINYQNEQGNEFCVSFPEDYVLIGTHFIAEQNKHIFFIVNPDTSGCEIGYMENNDCIYHTLIASTCLNFKITNPIHKVVHRITNCTTEIYWTDGINPRRYLDINNIPYVLASGSPLCDPIYSNEVDCNQLKMQPNFKIPQLEVVEISTGGSLTAGTYQFAAQYSDASGNGYTSYYSVTNPTPISDIQITSKEFNYPVGKSIVIDISHLDLTGQFQYFNLAVIKTVNAISSVELLGTYFIDSDIKKITYTGQNVENIRLSINDIFEKFPYYEVAEDLTAVQDVLVWDGLKSNERISYQKIANQIALQWETYKLPSNENYSDEFNATNLRGYLRDEVYAFEIVFLLNNGMQTDGFHIPGRTAIPSDTQLVFNTNDDYIEDGTSAPYWKIYNTATVIGLATGEPIGNATPYQYGTFAYWQSEETYPCDKNVWGDLSEQPIRHHKFPDVLVSPIYESKDFEGADLLKMGNDATFPIGVKLDVDQVKSLINSSTLTQEQKDSIVGFKIVRGDRSTNKSIVAKGILRNVGKYERENQEYYYPNYPYNDLKEDPFLNAQNNAWKDECQSFDILVLKFNLPEGNPTYLEIKYTDCNTNKPVTEKFTTLGIHKVCSVDIPIIQGPGLKNAMDMKPGALYLPSANCIGTVSYSNYDRYRIAAGSRGWRASWEDAIPGLILDGTLNSSPTEEWLSGGLFSSGRSFLINVRANTVPQKIGGPGSPQIDKQAIFRNDTCNTESPQPAFTTTGTLGDRQIFNSPETSFGQPFLGNILKLENVMFGKGISHFVEVKGNAKYKLLTEEAQQDALNASQKLGAVTSDFNVSAMFAAYQSYLTIYINGITRKNYAYSFNSIADYNYSKGVPNNLGKKQRIIDVAKYLIPGVQSTGSGVDDFPINNYQRESSVYLKTDSKEGTVDSLPFPSDSPYMVSGGSPILTENSRFTISDINHCSTPEKEADIQVVSYYASLKNKFVTQWGQIYSYKTIDTGFQRMFDVSIPLPNVVFGGDTFINRFAFKTKLPFFIDNRVNAPDDSDIFYDEIGNIAYPKFWHSARSILKDYSCDTKGTLPVVLSNIISYKAHNFDCPNSQEPGPPTVAADQNPNRTFYDGYFYMFAYGIPNFYCESSYNVDLRQAFDNRAGDFYPHVSSNIPDNWVQENFVSINNDNTYYYNTTYSKQNKEDNFSHLPPDFNPTEQCFTTYPFRAIYSEPQSTDADNRVNNWLTYRAVSYFDFPQNYGNLISLDGIQNKAILARFENKTLMYDNLLTIDTSNPQAAYMGNPNMFRKSPPIDFAETDLGYVGSQNKFLLKIPNGQITIDAKRGQVFLIEGTQAVDLSAFGSGMNRFFTDHLAFEILRYFPNVDTDNHFNGVGLHGVYDSKFDRVIITKLDYIPLDNNIKYDKDLKQFYIEEVVGDYTLRTEVFLTDPDYFCNKSWTVSFNFNTKTWVSFHTYLPNFYIAENNFFYSGMNGCCEDFDFVVGPLVPSPPVTTTTTTTRVLDCVIEADAFALDCHISASAVEIVPTTTTTTTAIPITTTTTTTMFVPGLCNNLLVWTLSPLLQTIIYVDCTGALITLNLSGDTGVNYVNICIDHVVNTTDGIEGSLVGECTTTTTTTTIPPDCTMAGTVIM